MLLSDYIKQLQKIQRQQAKDIEVGIWHYECATWTLLKEFKTKTEIIDEENVITINALFY